MRTSLNAGRRRQRGSGTRLARTPFGLDSGRARPEEVNHNVKGIPIHTSVRRTCSTFVTGTLLIRSPWLSQYALRAQALHTKAR